MVGHTILFHCLTGRDANSLLIEIGDDMSGRAIVPLMVQCPGVGSQQHFMLTIVRSMSVLHQKAHTSGEALISRASHHAFHFLLWAASPTLSNLLE